MVRITEDLVRKKAEHNECLIGTLEELSLHQEDVHKIENLQHWCKHLEILLLQSNLIPKIENLHKLKKLKYLNLAINSIELVENLERCESLEKLDLTLNFIGRLESVKTLQKNFNLRELYLTGNPCTDYPGYRQYVVVHLPQLLSLDNVEILHSERIRSRWELTTLEPEIWKAQAEYLTFRAHQKERLSRIDKDLEDEVYWHTKSEHAPETREEMSRRARKARGKDKDEESKGKAKKETKFFDKDGKAFNINQAKLKFTFNDEHDDRFILDIAVYKYLDTAYIDVDLQPKYARVSIKGKFFQFALPEEILVDKSTCQRSQTTGHLLLTMPRMNYVPKSARMQCKSEKFTFNDKQAPTASYLEVTPQPDMDFSKIVDRRIEEGVDPDMPALEYV